MRQWRVGTYSMGILLMILGGVMIYDRICGVNVMGQVLRWWPVILIILGLETILWGILSKESGAGLRYDGISILMTAIIVIFCIGAYGITSLFHISLDDWGIHVFGGPSRYETTVKKTIAVKPEGKDKFVVINKYGNVEISKGSGDEINIEAVIRVGSNDEAYARDICDTLIEVDKADAIKVWSKRDEYIADRSRIQNISIDYSIKIPQGLNVEVDNNYGKVNIENASLSVKVNNGYGDVSVKSAGRDVYINNSYAKVDVDGTGSDIKIQNKNGSVKVRNIGGGVTIENAYADVSGDSINGSASIKDNNGKIVLNKVEGKLTIDSKYCEIRADGVKGSVDIQGNNGNMDIATSGQDVTAVNKYGNIALKGGYGTIKLKTNNGSINFETDRVIEKSLSIENEYANMEVKIPKTQTGSFKASTKYGKITNSFNLGTVQNSNDVSISGTIGGGGADLNMVNKNGDIKINAK
jgi:Predicted ATP-dependent protease